MTKELKQAVLLTFVLVGAGIGLCIYDASQDTVAEGYLSRGDYGGATYSREVEVSDGDHSQHMTVEVTPRQYTEEEAYGYLEEAEEKLSEYMASNSQVRADMSLPSTLSDNPVAIEWLSTQPLILNSQGQIREDVPEAGTVVKLIATMTLQIYSREASYEVTVYPITRTEEETWAHEIKTYLEEEDTDSEVLTLPDQVNGKSLTWKGGGSSRGILIIFVGLIAGAALYGNTYFKAGEQKNQHKESMIRDYPYIVSKLVLLLGAGLSMRHAFDQIRRDYQSSLRQGGQTRAGYEEIGRMCADMDQGIPEEEAYRRLGQRCDLALYRTFSVLLVQNLKRGSQEVIDLFVREAENAFEERKKRARIQGEKASARLLMPTILMLGVVMVILMVPAFLTM